MIVYRLEDRRCYGAWNHHGIWCTGPSPSDEIPKSIWENKRYHYAAPALHGEKPRGFTEWFDPRGREEAARKGLRVAILDVAGASPYVTDNQILFFRDRAVMLDALHPVTLRSIGWHPSYDEWTTGP